MRILLANLRHLYQRRVLWLLYVGLGLIVGFVVENAPSTPTKGRGLLGGLLLCSFLCGHLVAVLPIDTASKLFCFCLPGHRDAVPRLVFLVGLVVSLAFLAIAIALLASPSSTGPFARAIMPRQLFVLVLGAYFCASMAAYLLAAAIAFSTMRDASFLALTLLVVVLSVPFNACPAIQYPIIRWPVAVTAVALAVSAASWWLGHPMWFRRSCTQPWTGLFDPWDRAQIQKRRAIRFTKNVRPGLDRFFQGRISNRRSSDLSKCVWGALYTTCSLIAPQWKAPLTVVVMMVVFAAYLPPGAPALIGIVISFFMSGFILMPMSRTLLVTGGRKERFFVTLTLLLVLSAVSVLLVGGLIGLTHWLAPLVPPIIVKGVILRPHPISFKVLLSSRQNITFTVTSVSVGCDSSILRGMNAA